MALVEGIMMVLVTVLNINVIMTIIVITILAVIGKSQQYNTRW
jgi:hypothetical protein